MADHILSGDVRSRIYFSAHVPGYVTLYMDHDLRYGEGPISLSPAAAEDLADNLELNAKLARGMATEAARRTDGPDE